MCFPYFLSSSSDFGLGGGLDVKTWEIGLSAPVKRGNIRPQVPIPGTRNYLPPGQTIPHTRPVRIKAYRFTML